MDQSDFSQLIVRFREQRGLSQGQLAQATRLSRTYVYHLETGQRENPSPHVVENIARALELGSEERQRLYDSYAMLTGQLLDTEQFERTLLDLGDLASLLVRSISYPTHSLDRLWYLHSWNEAAIMLFELQDTLSKGKSVHLLGELFDPHFRQHIHGWENLARRLVSDFLYETHTITHLPEYKALWKSLRDLPDFRRIASAAYPHGKPAPSFVFQVHHSSLGRLTLRTAMTTFPGISSYSIVSYVPGDQQTLEIYRKHGW